MADTFTSNLNLDKPEVGGSDDSWGTKINQNFDKLDDAIGGANDLVNALTKYLNYDKSNNNIQAIPLDNNDFNDDSFFGYNKTFSWNSGVPKNSPSGLYHWGYGVSVGSANNYALLLLANDGAVYFGVKQGNPPALSWKQLVTTDSPDLPPVGCMMAYMGNNIPSGWLKCDGSSFDGNQYPELKAALNGTVLPDARGYFPRGVDDGSNRIAEPNRGAVRATFGDMLINHAHSVNLSTDSQGNHQHTGTTNGSGGHSHGYSDLFNSFKTEDWNQGVQGDGSIDGQQNWIASSESDSGGDTHFPYMRRQTDGVNDHVHTFTTTWEGTHSHTVSGNTGGSSPTTYTETAPKSILVYWIIRAR